MRSTAHLDRLRVQLRAVIDYRDAYGLSDAVADRINDLECLIAHETRRQERRAVQRSFWARLVRSVVTGRGLGLEVGWEKGL